MQKILNYISLAIVAIVALDIAGAVAWTLTGQTPADNFYFGTLTIHALRFIF